MGMGMQEGYHRHCTVETPPECCCLLAQTNNPRKLQVLEELGVNVTGRIPCIVESQELNVGYLATKQVFTHTLEDAVSSMKSCKCQAFTVRMCVNGVPGMTRCGSL